MFRTIIELIRTDRNADAPKVEYIGKHGILYARKGA